MIVWMRTAVLHTQMRTHNGHTDVHRENCNNEYSHANSSHGAIGVVTENLSTHHYHHRRRHYQREKRRIRTIGLMYGSGSSMRN